MANVNIKFNGKEFLLSCENGQEEHLEERETKDKIKEEQFSEKIDELNQETDSLMNEIEKWQM